MINLLDMYKILYAEFGSQNWWPTTLSGKTEPEYHGRPLTNSARYEVAVGAILTQNTNWQNVKKAIIELNKRKMLKPDKILSAGTLEIETAIRSSGYYKQKAKKLKNLTGWWKENVLHKPLPDKSELYNLRESLLAVKGIGKETADSILLYALDLPIFVIDTYTKRIMHRHAGLPEDISYDRLQQIFMDNLPNELTLYKEYHALFVRLAKETCIKKGCMPTCVLRKPELSHLNSKGGTT